MTYKKHLFYSIISGCLLGLSWCMAYSGILLLIAFVPILLVAEDCLRDNDKHHRKLIFLYSSLTFLIWNTLAIWWICKATVIGGVTIILFNTTFFSSVFLIYYVTNKLSYKIIGFIAFVSYWASFEYVYTNAEIAWPMLNLGNGLSNCPALIQWYEYTGTLGGTIWILTINYLLFLLVKQQNYLGKPKFKLALATVLVILIPVSISLVRFYTYKETSNPVNVVVIQPNIDPFHEKFGGLSSQKQLNIIIGLANLHGRASTHYLLGPETAIDHQLWENNLDTNKMIGQLKQMIRQFPNAHWVIGATTYRSYQPPDTLTETARLNKNMNRYYDCFNSALQIDTTRKILIYHKSKLVVGIEKVPFPKMLKYFEKLLPNLGGLSGNLGIQKERSVFGSTNQKIKAGTLICYESCFGEFTSDFVKKGANLLFIITNDGWFGNSPGPWIHLNYACMRAIETRRSIARSANTGISASIDQRGVVTKALAYGQRSALETSINANSFETYYTKHGDYIGKYTSIISAGILLIFFILTINNHLLNKR